MSIPALSYDTAGYHKINFGQLTASSKKRVSNIFGPLKAGDNVFCAFDGKYYALFNFFKRPERIDFNAITLTAIKPKNDCTITLQENLPSFSGLYPGQYSFEIIAALKTQGYEIFSTENKQATIRKDLFDKGRCYHDPATEHFPERHYYGVNRTRIDYTLSGVQKSSVTTIMKSIRYDFIEDMTQSCN